MLGMIERVKQYPLIKQAFTFSFFALVSAASGVVQTQYFGAKAPFSFLYYERIGTYAIAAFLIKIQNRHAFVIGCLMQMIMFILVNFTKINESNEYGGYAFLIGSWSNLQICILLQAAFILFFEDKIYQMICLQMLIEENVIERIKVFIAEKDVPSITYLFASIYVVAIFISIVYIQRKTYLKEPEQKQKQNEYLSFRTSNRKKIVIYFVLFITIIICLCAVMINQTDPEMVKNKESFKVEREKSILTPFMVMSTLFIPFDRLYTLQAILLVVLACYWVAFQYEISFEIASSFYLCACVILRPILAMVQMNYIISFMRNSGYINPVAISAVIELSMKFYRNLELMDFTLGIKSFEHYSWVKQIESDVLFCLALVTGFLFLRQLSRNKEDHLPLIHNAEEEITKKPDDYQLQI